MMQKNMTGWLQDMLTATPKQTLPILGFPAVQALGVSVEALVADSHLQADAMVWIASHTSTAAALSLMDLSVEAECFGASVRMSKDEVPTVVGRLIQDEDDANALAIPAVGSGRSGRSVEAVAEAVKRVTDKPVLAGMIGPFSLAARLFDVSEIMMDCYDEPDMVHTVLEKCTAFLIAYAKAFKEVGAGGVLMAEPVAGMLSPMLEEEFSSPYVKQIVDAVQDDNFLVIYHNCGDNTLRMVDSILTTHAAAYHFGNAIDMVEMLQKMPADVVVMGNVDPVGVLWHGTPDVVRMATTDLMEKCKGYPNFWVSSGCDIPPATPWENINAYFEAVEKFDGT